MLQPLTICVSGRQVNPSRREFANTHEHERKGERNLAGQAITENIRSAAFALATLQHSISRSLKAFYVNWLHQLPHESCLDHFHQVAVPDPARE